MSREYVSPEDTLLEPGNPESAEFYAERYVDLHTMQSPLSILLRREPVFCGPDLPIRAVLETMNRHRVGSMIVVDGETRPIGIFTLPDLLARVTLPTRSLDDPISAVMTRALTTLPPDESLYQAALTMVRHGIRHAIVANEEGKLVGVVSQRDLFSLQRIGMHTLPSDIHAATDIDSLKRLSAEIQGLAHNMLVQGVGIEQLTHFIASLNDLLTQRVIDLSFGGADLGGLRWCWMALGSEGRFEQTFTTDQDNAIVFMPPKGVTETVARDTLIPLAKRVNRTLASCGFALCPGNIMAGNSAWCLGLDEWRRQFGDWIDAGDPEALLNASIFFDLRALHGEASLVQELKNWLLPKAQANQRFLRQMAANALRNTPPLGRIRDFALDGEGVQAHTLDIKANGTTLFVDAARILSLAAGVGETNTPRRLRLAATKVDLPATEIEAWVDAFLVLQRLRLKRQHLEYVKGEPMNNRLDPYRLHELDRLMLKESLRQAKKVQARLALDYQL